MRIIESEKYAQAVPQVLDQGRRTMLRQVMPQMNAINPKLQLLLSKSNPSQKSAMIEMLSILAEDPSQINKLKMLLSQSFMQEPQQEPQPVQPGKVPVQMPAKPMKRMPRKEDTIGNPFENGGEAL